MIKKLFALARYHYFCWRADRAVERGLPLSNRLLESLRAAHKGAIVFLERDWQICTEGGGLMIFHGTRTDALEFAAELGAIRYVDDEVGAIFYNPSK